MNVLLWLNDVYLACYILGYNCTSGKEHELVALLCYSSSGNSWHELSLKFVSHTYKTNYSNMRMGLVSMTTEKQMNVRHKNKCAHPAAVAINIQLDMLEWSSVSTISSTLKVLRFWMELPFLYLSRHLYSSRIIIIIIIVIIIIHLYAGHFNSYIAETNHVPRVYGFAAIL
jgi:hypothetical protein